MAEQGDRLISADYSQVELRLLAHIADEPVLKDIFRRGEDVHTATAEAILGGKTDPGTRSKAKMVNYGIVYGLSAFGLADRLQIEKEEAQQFIDAYLERFPKVKQFIEDTIAQRAATRATWPRCSGASGACPELRSRQFQTRSLGERLAVNMVIQGTAADIIKVAMVRARDELRNAGLSTRLVLQIHDELLFEGPEDEVERASEIVRREMAGRLRDGPAARGRRGRRRELARGQVSKEVAILATVAAGGAVAAQAPINYVLSKYVGSLGAVSVYFIVGCGLRPGHHVRLRGWDRGEMRAPRPRPGTTWILGGLAGRGLRHDGADRRARARRGRRDRGHDRRSADALGRARPPRGVSASRSGRLTAESCSASRCSPPGRF